ncbi:polyhydroxyalkanoate depolymerase [Chelatococcus sp. SYSU_G07232]|uniref:Polyhydroxyalkanoate depolymerase n=1 Tax=Chelatococcus albus TaxID=3047466 RepID=A0ABT7AIA6_9HYPH|nr:polyhydroxyalkanoate depolymerase [Chelatococcus sp. SYSU_G07232]MDJ1158815.1 polyhydroxyalkanoate depolymerase [Chelatococcus sp. SYSU_G07232]
MNLAYYWYEAAHAAVGPARMLSDATRLLFNNPANPLTYTTYGRTISAACELFERSTRRYSKPEFGLSTTLVGGERVAVRERVVWERPFCSLLHFERALGHAKPVRQPKLLIVAPMSGHYATLLRGTVEAFLPTHEVYITDWADARTVPLAEGRFDLDDYIDYVISMLHVLGPDVHVMAVCQPAVPVIAAVARVEAEGDSRAPRSMILMGGPIDTRRSPTAVNQLAKERGTDWFRRNCIVTVPMSYPGFMRDVYPGFLQLSGFMAMNLDRHLTAHWEMFNHLVEGDGDSAEKHREFYDEYLAVMDLTAEFYLQTVDTVFVRHALPKGRMMHRDKPVDLAAIRRTALMTVEGEKDDISGVGQTKAAHDLCVNLPDDLKVHHLQKGVGHYGVFNGSRFRAEIAPRIADFIATIEAEAGGRKGRRLAAE